MKTTLKKLSLVLTPVVAALLVAGCGGSSTPPDPVTVKLIAMNDFHGNLEVPAATNGGSVVVSDPANAAGTSVRTGGAAYLATLIKQLKAKNPNSIVVGAGDMIGAAPVTSTLTHNEASVDILGQLGLEVTSVGNHEFDQGKAELLRIQNGGCFAGGAIGKDTCINGGSFAGASYKYLAANVVDSATGKPLFPASYVKQFNNVSVGFIGLTLKGTPDVVTSTGVTGLSFLEEAATINTQAALLRASGVSAVVVLIHQGGQTTASTLNDQSCPNLSGDILPIVDALGKDVDVVVSGHTHQEYVCRRNGKLVTSTGFYGSAVTEIDLTITPGTGVTAMTANTVPVINDLNTKVPAGYTILAKDATVDAAVQKYVALTSTLKNAPAGTITASINRALLANSPTPTRDETAEGPMGDVMADVYLTGGPKADIAFINPGGVRADLIFRDGGVVTYGDLLTVAPFGNTLVAVDLTGTQIVRLLEQQWEAANCAAKFGGANGCGRMLQPSSSFSYSWNASAPSGAADGTGNRVLAGSLKLNGQVMDLTKTYRVIFNNFMAPGPGDNFNAVTKYGKNLASSGVIDIDAFAAYMKNHPNLAPPAPRVIRIN